MFDMESGTLLSAESAEVTYRGREGRRTVKAVRGVSLSLPAGGTLGIVGESGCGKSSLAWALAGLTPLSGGCIRYRDRDVTALDGRERLDFRRAVQVVFQDPLGALNPRLTIGQALDEVLWVHRGRNGLDGAGRRARVVSLLDDAGLEADLRDRYPHELSGGQRQRAGIARALAVEPEVLVADEPVSALDVSVQVQILNLLRDLTRQRGLGLILVSHDLAVVRYLCRDVVVMYLGSVMESGRADALFDRCTHPYTAALLSAVPDIDRVIRGEERVSRIVLPGDTPAADTVLPGCPFRPRCPEAQARCADERPVLRETAPGQSVACHFPFKRGIG